MSVCEHCQQKAAKVVAEWDGTVTAELLIDIIVTLGEDVMDTLESARYRYAHGFYPPGAERKMPVTVNLMDLLDQAAGEQRRLEGEVAELKRQLAAVHKRHPMTLSQDEVYRAMGGEGG